MSTRQILLGALVLLLLGACGPAAPRLDFGPKAAEEYRLDLGHGVVVTFDKGPSSEAQGKVAYITHIPSGSQMVIGREGQVIIRHDGRGDGPAQLDVILADEAIMGRIIAGANAEDLPLPQHADWVHFVKFEGIMYLANRRGGVVSVDDLGAERYRIAFRLQDYAGGGYRSQDGDAAYLAPGTPIFELKRYTPKFRLAAVVDGEVTLFEADTNPAARTGADLLDIRGRVRSIGINSPQDARTELASIDDPEVVERLVEIVLSAPVDQSYRNGSDERYFIAFHLEDGTAVIRSYWLGSGELHRGMMTPPSFRVSVLQALARARTPAPTPTPSPRTTATSCTGREEAPPCGPRVEIGNPYPYALYTHCGIRSAYFDGRRWIADPVLSVDNVNPPPGWGNPSDKGSMELVAEDLARFTNKDGLVAEFRPLPEGSEYPWGPCL